MTTTLTKLVVETCWIPPPSERTYVLSAASLCTVREYQNLSLFQWQRFKATSGYQTCCLITVEPTAALIPWRGVRLGLAATR